MDSLHSSSSGIPPPALAPRRGRREKPWPPGKQKKLLRLYVCTQSERLPLVRILERLKDSTFDPRQRNSHKHLKNLLPDRRIDDWRPRDLATMLVRVRFLRSVREERRRRHRRYRMRLEMARAQFDDASSLSPQPVMSLSPLPVSIQQQDAKLLSPIDQPQTFDSPVAIKQSQSPGSTPPTLVTSSASPPDSYPRDKSPSRASSAPSSTKSAKRRSWASVLSSISSGISSLARSSSSASSKQIVVNPSGVNTALSKMTREEFLASLQDSKPIKKGSKLGSALPTSLFKRYSTSNPPDEELNMAILRMCCANHARNDSSQHCVHVRLSDAIEAQATEGPAFRHFTLTDDEANMVDKYGNTLLHTAARWGARISLLLLILRHTDDVQAVNHRGETFLHVYYPPEDPRMKPVSFLNLLRQLRARGFDFCHRDVEKQTFLQPLVAKKGFPVETLYYVFREVGQGAARFLVANRCANGERLWHSIRRNLDQAAPKLHRIFGDELEFIRRYLPEFSCETKAPSTADTSTLGSESSISVHPNDSDPDPNDRNSAQNLRRTPMMKLFRRAASGRGFPDKELVEKLESLFESASKQPDFDLQTYLGRRDTEGNSALHYAAEFGLVPAVQFLCAKGAQVNVFNNCGNTPLQLVKFAIQRTDVRSDIHMEARYLRCAVILLENGAFDQSKLVSERSEIFPFDVFDGSERSIANLVKQGVASQCRGLHLLTSSMSHPHCPPLPPACHGEDGEYEGCAPREWQVWDGPNQWQAQVGGVAGVGMSMASGQQPWEWDENHGHHAYGMNLTFQTGTGVLTQ